RNRIEPPACTPLTTRVTGANQVTPTITVLLQPCPTHGRVSRSWSIGLAGQLRLWSWPADQARAVDLSVALGCLLGQQWHREFGWEWRVVILGEYEDTVDSCRAHEIARARWTIGTARTRISHTSHADVRVDCLHDVICYSQEGPDSAVDI